jgi:integrase
MSVLATPKATGRRHTLGGLLPIPLTDVVTMALGAAPPVVVHVSTERTGRRAERRRAATRPGPQRAYEPVPGRYSAAPWSYHVSGARAQAAVVELERAGLSVSTQRLTHAVAHRALRDSVRWGRLVRNPADMADPPATGQSRAQAWTARELARFLEHVPDERLFPLWRLAATTGIRRRELAGLTRRCLDIEGARLSVEQQLVSTRGGVSFGPPKSSRSRRTIALDPETARVLREHREAQLLERDLAGEAYGDRDLVFADELGGPIHPQRLTEWFGKARKAKRAGSRRRRSPTPTRPRRRSGSSRRGCRRRSAR